jgi:hypothetical protein
LSSWSRGYAARVLGLRVRVEVEPPLVVHRHVLEHRAEGRRRAIDLRLVVGVQADDLGVAAPLEVEDAVVAPPVLVVADERAHRVGGEGRLPRARKAEEEGDVAALVDVRGAVHREDAAQREEVVEDGEDRFLDLARVLRASDEHDAAGEVEDDEGFGACAVARGIRGERGRVEDVEVGAVGGQRVVVGTEEKVPREEGVPGALRDEADREALFGIGAGGEVLHPELLRGEMSAHPLEEGLEARGIERLVDAAPGDLRFGRLIADDELVLRGAARVGGSVDHERAADPDPTGAATEGLFVEAGGQVVPVDRGGAVQAQGLQGRRRRRRAAHDGPFCPRGGTARQDSAGKRRVSTVPKGPEPSA